MKRCLELAALGKGFTRTNPLVGCVIVHNGTIVAEGYHQKFGEAHAEVNAFNQLSDKSILNECDVYVNLEPCSHEGKTPPCTQLFDKYPCKRLIVGMLDPNEKVAGKGIDKIKSLGIAVEIPVLENECQEINKTFTKSILTKTPYVIAKWAQSADGFIAKENQRTAISNDLVNSITQQWRKEHDAILIGSKTLKIDEPKLNLRTFWGKQPLRCVIGDHINTNNPFFTLSEPGIVFSSNASLQLPSHFRQLKTVNPNKVLEALYKESCGTLVIEGGANTIAQFSDCIDEIRIITNHSLLLEGGVKAPKINLSHFEETTISTYRDNTIQFMQRVI